MGKLCHQGLLIHTLNSPTRLLNAHSTFIFRLIFKLWNPPKTKQLDQGSVVFPRTPLVVDTGNSRMAARNVDENIYHWKILNVSSPDPPICSVGVRGSLFLVTL